MSASAKLRDPLAGVLGLVAGVGAFFLIPGALVAAPAALGIGALVYGAKVAVSSLTDDEQPAARPAVGAGAGPAAAPRIKRGSAAETWKMRGEKAIATMDELVAGCQQPVIQGQLENVAIEARDCIAVLDQLAMQTATIERSFDQMPTSALRQDEGNGSVARLADARAGLENHMESLVIGLERLLSEMNETLAASVSDAVFADDYGRDQLRDLGDQLAGLRQGLAETKRYTADILGPKT